MIKMVDIGSQAYKVYDKEGISPTLITCQGGGKVPMFMMSHTKANIKQRVQDRDTTWTLDTSGNRMALHDKTRIRKLTPLECERLMGFPDGWTEGVSDTQRYKLVGNSVIVPVIEYIGNRFKKDNRK